MLKFFADYYITKKLVVYGELVRTLGYGLNQYANGADRSTQINYPSQFLLVKDGFFFNIGMALRIREDF